MTTTTTITITIDTDDKEGDKIEFHPIDTDEYPGYFISRSGDVLSTKRKEMKILNPRLDVQGYYCVTIRNKNGKRDHPRIHRLLAKVFIENSEDKPCVDHIDGCRMNNSLENLRWCTYQQNQHNRGSDKNTSSKYKGVSWYKARGKWKVTINIDGKNRHLGLFKSEHDAHLAYDAKAREVHGEFYRPHQ
jgi:hypothetical protein